MSPKHKPLFSFSWSGKACGVNKRYAYRSNKKLSDEYDAFKQEIAWTIRASWPGHYEGKLWLQITMRIDFRRDSDSLLKPLFDGIEASGVIDNDNQIRGYAVWVEDKIPGEPDEIDVSAFDLCTAHGLNIDR